MGDPLVGCGSFPVATGVNARGKKDESCPGLDGSEGSEWMVGARRLERIDLFGRKSSKLCPVVRCIEGEKREKQDYLEEKGSMGPF